MLWSLVETGSTIVWSRHLSQLCRLGVVCGDVRMRSESSRWLIVLLTLAAFGFGVAGSARAADPLLWGRPMLIERQGLGSVSCPTTSFCVALDPAGYVVTSTDPGGGASAWSSGPSRINAAAGLFGVSCPSSSLCVAVGGGSNEPYVATSIDPVGGSVTWNASALSGGDQLSAVSCPSVSLCVAVGYGGTVATSTDPAGGAGTWRVIQASTSIPFECGKYGPGEDCQANFTAVSCPSVSLCVAVDSADNSLGDAVTSSDPTGGAAAWDAIPVDKQSGLTGVSCPTMSLCLATDFDGKVLASAQPTGSAAAWVTEYHGGGEIAAVSCGSMSLCVETAGTCCNLAGPPLAAGIVATSVDPLDGARAWTRSEIAPSATGGLGAVSCVSSRMCVTVGSDGIAVAGMPPTRGQIEKVLRTQITPPRRNRRIAPLLRRGSERLALRAIGAGSLQLSWSADRLRIQTHDKTVVATARVTFDHTRTIAVNLKLTRAGNRLLRHRRHVDIAAKARFIPIGRAPVVVIKRFALS